MLVGRMAPKPTTPDSLRTPCIASRTSAVITFFQPKITPMMNGALVIR